MQAEEAGDPKSPFFVFVFDGQLCKNKQSEKKKKRDSSLVSVFGLRKTCWKDRRQTQKCKYALNNHELSSEGVQQLKTGITSIRWGLY